MNPKIQAWDAALAAELRAERARHLGLTIDDLAARAQISKVSAQRYLSGARPVNMNVLAAFCEAFGVSVTEIVQRTEAAVTRMDPPIARTGS